MFGSSRPHSLVGMTTTDTTEPAGLADYKRFARDTWASGDFPEIARRGLWGVGAHLVQRVGVGAGERVREYTPPLPPFASPPILWGTEAHVRELFTGSGVQLEFERAIAEEPEPFADGNAAVDFLVANFGPLMKLHGMLAAQGKWERAREKLVGLYDQHEPAEYLVVLGRKG